MQDVDIPHICLLIHLTDWLIMNDYELIYLIYFFLLIYLTCWLFTNVRYWYTFDHISSWYTSLIASSRMLFIDISHQNVDIAHIWLAIYTSSLIYSSRMLCINRLQISFLLIYLIFSCWYISSLIYTLWMLYWYTSFF